MGEEFNIGIWMVSVIKGQGLILARLAPGKKLKKTVTLRANATGWWSSFIFLGHRRRRRRRRNIICKFTKYIIVLAILRPSIFSSSDLMTANISCFLTGATAFPTSHPVCLSVCRLSLNVQHNLQNMSNNQRPGFVQNNH